MRLRKRAQTTHLALFGPFVSFFFFKFFCVLLSLMTVLGTIYLQEGLGKVAATKTGPNDALLSMPNASFGPFISFFFFPIVFYGY